MDTGWIKLYRSMANDPVWANSTLEQKVVLMTILWSVNWDARQWDINGKKIMLHPGQMFISTRDLVKKCGSGVSHRNVRTSLERFENLGFLTQRPTHKGILITVVNWEKYQSKDSELTHEPTQDRHKGDTSPTQDRHKGDTTIKEEGKKVRREEGKKDQRDIEKGTAFVPLVVGEENEKESEERKEEEEKFPYDLLREEEVNKEGREKAREASLRTEEKVVGKEGEKTSYPTVRQIFKDYADHDMDLFEALIGWKEAREKIKKPFTERAARMAIHKLEDLSGGENKKKIAIINQSTFKCWTDIYPLRKDFSTKGKYDNSKNKWEGVTGL